MRTTDLSNCGAHGRWRRKQEGPGHLARPALHPGAPTLCELYDLASGASGPNCDAITVPPAASLRVASWPGQGPGCAGYGIRRCHAGAPLGRQLGRAGRVRYLRGEYGANAARRFRLAWLWASRSRRYTKVVLLS